MNITIQNKIYDVDLLAVDKDGTLINFEEAWTGLIKDWIGRMITVTENDDIIRDRIALHHDLCRTLGYDPQLGKMNPDGLAAVASVNSTQTAASVVLHQHGYLWPTAEDIVRQTRLDGFELTAETIQPVGDVRGSMARLHQAGMRIAVITNDDRPATLKTLAQMELSNYVELLACGDDPWPSKPDPAGLFQIAKQTGIPVERIMMIGDTISDMMTGQNAGTVANVAVTGGGGNPAVLGQYADAVINSLDDILI